MPGGKLWADIRLTEADLRILGRFLRRTGQSWHDFATEAVRAYLREAEADVEADIAHRRRLVESWGAPMPTLGEAPEGAEVNPEAEADPPCGFAIAEAARRAHR